jgi:hypothetical protein
MPASRRHPQDHCLHGILLLAYLASFLLPAIRSDYGYERDGLELFTDGLRRAYEGTATAGTEEAQNKEALEFAGGVANPLIWLAFWALFTRRWLLAGAFAAGAFALALCSVYFLFVAVTGQQLGIGCYLWLGSILAVALVGNLNWRYCLIGRS